MKYIRGYFDGSCEPVNPGGTAKYGFVILNEEDCVLFSDHGLVGEGEGMTNNVGEYVGLIECLSYLLENHKDDLLEVYGDSKMVINMTGGTWGKKKPHKNHPHLAPLLAEAREVFDKLENCSLHWIPREQNSLADFMSKL